jgi:DNA-binding response OmpR family regulator
MPKILLIDQDNHSPFNGKIVKSYLECEKENQVDYVTNIPDAFCHLLKAEYDCIVTEASIEDLYPFLKNVRSMNKYESIPVVVLTSIKEGDSVNLKDEISSLGEVKWYQKPFDIWAVETVLHELNTKKYTESIFV